MAHFAKVLGDKVTQVIVAEPEFFDTFIDSTPGMWIQTSYNTHGGQHLLGREPLRKNFAGIGFTYNYNLDAFIPPKPYNSWILNEETCLWESPIEYPSDGLHYGWDETTTSWTLITE
jgi:hypothetical protein